MAVFWLLNGCLMAVKIFENLHEDFMKKINLALHVNLMQLT